jgi:hypothetical protein
MFWMPVFTGMTMLMSSLRLRHSLLAMSTGKVWENGSPQA